MSPPSPEASQNQQGDGGKGGEEERPEVVATSKAALDVLIVEDDPQFIKFMIWAAQEAGYQKVVGISKANEVAPFLAKNIPRLLCCDIIIDKSSGLDLYLSLKAERLLTDATRVVFVTGFDESSFKEQAMLIGADDYLVKPFRAGDVKRIFNRLLSAQPPPSPPQPPSHPPLHKEKG